jgi:hypothetical protein
MQENAIAFISALNTAKVVLEQLFGSQTMANILYFANSAGWDEPGLTELAEAVRDWWIANMQPLINAGSALTAVTATDVESATGPTVTVPVSPAEEGALTGAALPTNCAIVVTFRAAGRGRSSRGRNYIGGLDADTLASNTDMNVPSLGNFTAAYEDLSDVELATGATHVVVSYYHEKAPRTTALVQPVQAVTGDTHLDSQRRRLAGRGI